MWKKEARDSTEKPSQSNKKVKDQMFLPSAPEEPIYTNRHAWALPEQDLFCYNKKRATCTPYSGPCLKIDLFSKIGLHYYNLQKGTNLKFLTVQKYDKWLTSILTHFINLEAIDPISNSSCEFEAQVRYAIENIDCLSAITTVFRLKPKTPEDKGEYFEWNKEDVDDFFKGDMPDWLLEDALNGRDKLQYYEMNNLELQEENEWLHLYAELALFSKWESNLDALESAKPFEMKKVVVRTKEDVESKKKVKAEDAIFYISFKTRCGQNCNGIIRKTTDKMPEHFSLEVKCLV